MFLFTAGKVLGVGLSRGNLIKLQQDKPIEIDLSKLNSPDVNTILIFFGEDERVMKERLQQFIGPETKVIIDPRLKDH